MDINFAAKLKNNGSNSTNFHWILDPEGVNE
jgi:hypothetical protein